MLSLKQIPLKDHSYFSDVEPNRDECIIDWVPSGKVCFASQQIKHSPIMCFRDYEEFILSLIENDPDDPLIIITMPRDLFMQFAACERQAWILPPKYTLEDGDYGYFLALNENGFISGEWFEASVDFQENFYDSSPGLLKGYELVVLDIFSHSSLTL